MGKVQWKPGNMIYPLPAVIVTCGETEEEYNGLTIAWTGTVCTNPPMTYISVRPTRHSYPIIKRQGGFVINLTTEAMAFATDYVGVRSGAKEDKLKKMGLEYEIGEIIKAPLLKDSPVCIECETVDIQELGSHHMFLAKVVKVHVDESLMDDTGKFHLDQAHPLVYNHGHYFGLGEPHGRFGHSVMKGSKDTKRNQRNKKTNNKNTNNKNTNNKNANNKNTNNKNANKASKKDTKKATGNARNGGKKTTRSNKASKRKDERSQ